MLRRFGFINIKYTGDGRSAFGGLWAIIEDHG